jgi:hypothetical protein
MTNKRTNSDLKSQGRQGLKIPLQTRLADFKSAHSPEKKIRTANEIAKWGGD